MSIHEAGNHWIGDIAHEHAGLYKAERDLKRPGDQCDRENGLQVSGEPGHGGGRYHRHGAGRTGYLRGGAAEQGGEKPQGDGARAARHPEGQRQRQRHDAGGETAEQVSPQPIQGIVKGLHIRSVPHKNNIATVAREVASPMRCSSSNKNILFEMAYKKIAATMGYGTAWPS
jgi:hypothetical protein